MSPAKTTKKTAKKAPAKKAAAKKTTKAPAKKVARKAVAKTPAKKTTAKTAAKKVATKKPAAKKKTTKKKIQVITASERHSMIAEAAYFAAESFGFGGDSHGHWLYAEAQIDADLTKGGVQVSA